LEKSLTPLVITSGFDGKWIEVLGRAEEIAAEQIVMIMMSGNELDKQAAFAFGMYSISTILAEEEMAALVSNLLFGDLHDYTESSVGGQPLEPDGDLDPHEA